MSQLNVDNIRNRTGSNGGPNFPSGITVAVGQTAYIHGNLQVDGTETIVNTETLNVADKTVGIGSTSNASNTTADGAGIEVFASSSQTGNNKTITWQNSSNAWTFGGGGIVATDSVVGSAVTINSSGIDVTGVVTATSFKGDGSLLTGIDATSLKDGGGSIKIQANSDGAEVTGILTATSFVGDGSGLTDVPGGNIITGIASGSIASDKCMSLTHDGKILQMESSVIANSNPAQSGGTYTPYGGSTEKMNVLYVPGADRFVMFMRDGSARFRYNVINIVGPQMIAGGTQVFGGEDPGGARWYPIRSVNLGNSMIAVLYSDTNNHGQGKIAIGTVVPNNSTGGTITFPNSPAIFTGNYACTYGDICYDPNQDKIVIVYQYSNSQGQAIVGDVSGTGSSATVTFGTPVDINGSNNAQNLACVYDESASRVVITWENHGDSRKLYGRTASVSGTTITMGGSATDLNGGSTGADLWLTMSYAGSPQNMSVVAYRIGGVGMVTKALSVSGDTITAYTRQTVHASGNWLWGNVKYDNGIGRICYFYVRDGNSEAAAIKMADLATNGTISNFSNFHEFDTGNTECLWGDTNEVGRGVCGYEDDNGSHTEAATPIVGSEGGNISDPGQYLGFADQAYTDGQTVTVVTLGNTKTGLVGLTTGSTYYAQADGTIATTWDSARFASFATNTPKAGRAISSTSLQIFQPS